MTHKAQSVTSIATKWNVCASLDTFDDLDNGETPKYPTSRQHFQILSRRRDVSRSSDDDEDGEVDSDLDNTTIHPIYARAISFQKRQALGKESMIWKMIVVIISLSPFNYFGFFSYSDISREQQSWDHGLRILGG